MWQERQRYPDIFTSLWGWRKFNDERNRSASMHCKYNIESDIAAVTLSGLQIPPPETCPGRLATSPTLSCLHLYSLTFYLSRVFRYSFYDRCLCHARYYDRTSALALSSFSLSLFNIYSYTYTSNACTCIYQNGWRVTRCLPVIRMNHRVAEKALGGLGLRISLRTLRVPYAVPRVSVLYNTRACCAQANRRAYSSRENARRLFRHRFPRSRRLLVADGNYSSATSRKIQGHDYLVSRAATYDA